MTLGEALRRAGIDPREARLLLGAATGFSQSAVLAFPERLLPGESEKAFFSFVSRRAAGEPIAYILGRKEFYGLELEVDAAVLIPRPETELLVELALQRHFSSALDLGTGCGAIALALKRQRPDARVVAADESDAALEVARRNSLRLGVDLELRQGRWFEPFAGERFDLVVSNPPYVAAGDPHLADLGFEPACALVAGPDGLDALREIARDAPRHLAPGGWLLVEHGIGQEHAVRRLLQQAGLEALQSWPDLSGIARVAGARR